MGGDGSVVTYGYNAGGMRVRSQAGSNAPVFYIFDGSALLGEVQASGGASNVQAAYTWRANGLVSERLFAANSVGRSLWYAFDGQGAARVLTDASGAIADTYQYPCKRKRFGRTLLADFYAPSCRSAEY